MNNYQSAYAIGYFYGRAYPNDERIAGPDMYHRESIAFRQGIEDGKRDFQEVDLPEQALAQPVVDPL